MVSSINTEIFLPIKFEVYKRNKINVLKVQLKAVNTVQRIKRLSELSRTKTYQIKALKNTIKEIKHSYKNMQNLLPTSFETGIHEITHTEKVKIKTKDETVFKFQTTSKIDEDLKDIQEKLKNIKI